MILDSNTSEDIPRINLYKKSKGIMLAKKWLPELNQVEKFYLIDSLEDWRKVEEEFPPEMMTVRCDCPRGLDAKLPSGETFERARVPEYIKKVKSKVPDAVIILEKMKDGSNERIHTQGGVDLEMNIGKVIRLEYVGPSFDARELCAAKAAHEAWVIPWEDVPFMKDSAIRKYKVGEISHMDYIQTARERLHFLFDAYPNQRAEILRTMPTEFKGMDIRIFREIRDKVIFPLWEKSENLLRDGLNNFIVEINIMQDGRLVPMEMAVQERFKEKSEHER